VFPAGSSAAGLGSQRIKLKYQTNIKIISELKDKYLNYFNYLNTLENK
jgi:hypothetical protein